MKSIRTLLPAAALALISGSAMAHTGGLAHVHASFAQGLLHPFSGADHLLAMLAVGAWSALASRRQWVAPLAFVGVLGAGACASAAGLAVPAIEPMIAASLLVLGLLLATLQRLPLAAAGAVAALFAFFHGAAHGNELGAAPAALAGMVVATALLHVAGMALGRTALARWRWAPQASGAVVASLGVLLLARLA